MQNKKIWLYLLVIFVGGTYYFMGPYKQVKKQKEADLLYTKVNEFLHDNENISPENFEDKCVKYIQNNSGKPKILNKETFDAKSKNKIILYRGINGENAKKYTEEFKHGKIYIGKNIHNVRGNGIYTTANYKCAQHFADSNETIVTMFLNNKKNILENKYLEELKDIMVKKHSDEFSYIVDSIKMDLLYSPIDYLATEYLFKEYIPDFDVNKLYELNFKEIAELEEKLLPPEALADIDVLSKAAEKAKSDSRYAELKQEKKYFKDKKAALYYNSGLLAKLLGYDVLHTDEYDEELKVDIQEYLILDPEIISIKQ